MIKPSLSYSRFSFALLSMADIDVEDRRFWISFPERPASSLAQSIQEAGLCSPMVVWRQGVGAPWVIVAGRRRYLALRALGRDEVPALAVSSDTAASDLFHLNLYDNWASRGLNPMEVALAVTGLLAVGAGEEEIRERVLPKISPDYVPADLRLWSQFAAFPQRHQEALADQRFHPRLWERLLKWDDSAREAVLDLFLKLKAGRNDQRRLIDRLEVISYRERCGVSALINDPALRLITDDGRVTESQRLSRLFTELESRFRPGRWHLTEAFSRLARSLGAGFRLDPPANFEGERIKASFSFASPNELRQAAERLQGWAGGKEAEEIFALLRGRRKAWDQG